MARDGIVLLKNEAGGTRLKLSLSILRKKDLTYWSVEQQQWTIPTSEFGVARCI